MPTDSERGPGDRRTRRHRATQLEIIDATWQLSSEHGLTGWSMRDVAEAVGMRAPSLYVYFGSKLDLYDALFADGYRRLDDALGEVAPRESPEEDLEAGTLRYFDFCVSQPARFQLLFLHTIPGFTPSEHSYAAAIALFDRLSAALDAVGVDPAQAIDLLTAVITGLIAQQISNDPGGERWRRLLPLALDAVLQQSGPHRVESQGD